MGIAKSDRFAVLRLGRRTMLRMMVFGVAGLMCLGTVGEARADETPGSFWTQFTPSSDTRLIFVSFSEGNDANSGLTPAQPVKTLAKAESLLRDGFPDWMLLKRGDVWDTPMPFWSKSGRNETEMMVVGAYGGTSERPQIRPPGSTRGMQSQGNTETRYVAFVGLHFEPASRTDDETPGGISWFRRGGNILFEDLYVGGWGGNFNIQSLSDAAPVDNIRINGCIVVDSWSKAGHSQGIFSNGVNGLTIENSVVASNGFSRQHGAEPTIFNHNIYITKSNENIVVRNNIIADASSHGIQLRPGGVLEDNLFISNPLSILISNQEGVQSGDVVNSVRRNMIMYGRDISAELPRKFGIDINSLRTGVISDNILFSAEYGQNIRGIGVGDGLGFGMENVLVEGNTMVGWEGEIMVSGPNTGVMYRGLRVVDNLVFRDFSTGDKPFVRVFEPDHPEVQISGNRYYYTGTPSRAFVVGTTNATMNSWASSVEEDAEFTVISQSPDLGLDAYLASLGRTGGFEEFVAAARRQSRQSSDPSISPTAVYAWMKARLPD